MLDEETFLEAWNDLPPPGTPLAEATPIQIAAVKLITDALGVDAAYLREFDA